MRSNNFRWIITACLAVMLTGGMSQARAGVSDAWVSAKVKMQLMNSPQVSGLAIDVDTDEGRVTLHGKVPSGDEKAEAGRIARTSTGVTSVRNLLQVVPESRRNVVEVADDRLKDDVDAALRAEPSLESSSIHARSINKGVVLLAGKATTLSAHLLALEVTSAIPGVRQVASEIESPSEFADREIWNDEAPSDAAHGNAMTDGWITTQTKMRFMTNADIRAGDINVDTRRGVVTLFGTVPTSAVSEKAYNLAKDVAGVRSVNSELRVVAASQEKHAAALDGETASAIRKRLAEARMEGADVKVDVKGATARLSGTVQYASHRAERHAGPGPGEQQQGVASQPGEMSRGTVVRAPEGNGRPEARAPGSALTQVKRNRVPNAAAASPATRLPQVPA
jgi:hyperosmotically inducible protein